MCCSSCFVSEVSRLPNSILFEVLPVRSDFTSWRILDHWWVGVSVLSRVRVKLLWMTARNWLAATLNVNHVGLISNFVPVRALWTNLSRRRIDKWARSWGTMERNSFNEEGKFVVLTQVTNSSVGNVYRRLLKLDLISINSLDCCVCVCVCFCICLFVCV